MEVVQGGGSLVCAPRGPAPSTHPPLRLGHHHAEGPAAAALHVQTEEGGGSGLDPSWWRISASGSWDGGERRMRYGKLIDDRPGAIPGAVQRRKLELLETHAPGTSMRVVHSQSTSSWRQGGGSELSSTGLDSSGSSRSLLSSSSSTRVTSYRQWSTNFSQTPGNVAALKQETRPVLTEFGNLELALNPLDVSFLRTRGNVGRSGSIGSRRPPTRPRRLSSGAPSPDSGDSSAEQPAEAKSPDADYSSASVEAEGDGRRERSSEAPIAISPVTDGIRDSVSRLMALGWHPPGSGVPPHPLLHSTFRTSTPLHRKRSVSSEDVRGQEDGSDASSHGGDVEDAEGVVKWERGVSVRRSLPSSEWRSAVGSVADGVSRRPRDPPKSSSVPALGGPASAGPASAVNRKSSLVTAESLREMKGRLKHRGSLEAMAPQGGCRAIANGFAVGDGAAVEGPKVSLRAAREEVNDDRRKSWSVGCRNLERREVINDEEDSSTPSSRRRSYAFEFSEEGKEGGSSSSLKKESDWTHLQNGVRGESGHRVMIKGISSSESGEFVHSRVNEMLKKWTALTQGPGEDDSVRRVASSSPTMRSLEGGGSRNSTTMWLEHGDVVRLENGGEPEVDEFATPAATLSGARTSLRLTHAKDHSSFKEELVTSRSLDKVHQLLDELPPSTLGPLVEDYSCPRGLSPVDWCDGESNGVLSIKEVPAKGDQGMSASSAGILVTFSSADGGDGYSNNNGTRHHSVTHLESKELEGLRSDGPLRIRASKKVEFSKTEVHFAAESGRFHIVETAGKPPPSNNFRRRRRSPTGTLNVDSGAVGGRGPSALSNGMRFGDSPYEKRLLAGTDGAEMPPQREKDDEDADGTAEDGIPGGDQLAVNGETSFEYGFASSRVFEDLDSKEEKEVKNVLTKVQDLEIISTPLNYRHAGLDDALEKPRGILRSNSVASNPFPWKTPQKNEDDSDDGMKPKFGGVHLRPVISPELHTKINLSSLDTSDPSRVLPAEKAIPSPLSPGQMELQKLLKSLRPVSVAPYVDNVLSQNNDLGTQVANGGGMEVRISSGNQVVQTNMVMIGSDTSADTVTPLSVAQRVREVEERRQRELKNKLANNQRMTNRAAGQFSTRVTLGPVSAAVVPSEPHILAKKLIPQTLSSSPSPPKVAAKISTHSKITRIQTSQDKVGPLQIVRKGMREEMCSVKQRSEILAPSQEKAAPKAEADPSPAPFGHRFVGGWQAPLSPLHLEIAPLQPIVTRRLSSTSSKVEDLWFKGLLTTAQPSHQPPPSASWPSARGFGRVGDDRVMLKSPSLILQTMLNTAFPPKEAKEAHAAAAPPRFARRECTRTAEAVTRAAEGTLLDNASRETLMHGDKLQPNLSILRALYRDASEEECSDAYEASGRLLGGSRGGGESRLGDGGSVVSGSWRRLRRAKQQQQACQRQTTELVPIPKPAPRKQSGKSKAKSVEPPRPPPRNHRVSAHMRMRRVEAKGGGVGGGREERARRRGGGGECGGKGDASAFVGDNLQHNQSDSKASALAAESRSRSEHCQDAAGITRIALGQRIGRTKGDGRECRDDFVAAKEGGGTGPDAGRCKIFSALSVGRGREDDAATERVTKGDGMKALGTRETSPEGPRESKSSPWKTPAAAAWGFGRGVREGRTREPGHAASRDSFKSQRRAKEVAPGEAQKKENVVSSPPPPEAKIFSGVFGGPPAYDKSSGKEVEEGMDSYSVKLKVMEKRMEEVGSQPKSRKSDQRRSSLDEKSRRVVGEAARGEARPSGTGGTQTPRSPRLSEATRVSHVRQSALTTARPASPRQSVAAGDHTAAGSPTAGRALRKRVRRRASGGVEEERRQSERKGGEEVSEESAILAELTRAADEILHVVNGYSDDPTSDEDAASGAAAAARCKRRAARAQHSKRTSSTVREVPKGAQSVAGAVRSGGSVRAKPGAREQTTKERTQAKDGPPQEVTPRGMARGQQGALATSSSGPPHGGSPVARSVGGGPSEKGQRLKQQHHTGASGSPRAKGSTMTRVEPTNRVAEVKLIEKRPPLPPGGQRRSKDGLKERSEVHTRGKTKTSSASTNPLSGESEVNKSEAKRSMNIARALEAVMPDPRNKTRKVEKKTDEHMRKDSQVLQPASPQLSPGISLSLERKKVASSREGDKTTRRGIHPSSNSPT